MSRLQFDNFFHVATGNSPYYYPCRFSCGGDARSNNPETLLLGRERRCLSMSRPTLLNHPQLPNSDRGGYCLPMRTFVGKHSTAEQPTHV